MMVFHHMYCATGNGQYSFLNWLFGDGTDLRLAWVCRLCVPFFSFVSGYGLSEKVSGEKKPYPTLTSRLLIGYKMVFAQIIKLLKRYWLIILLFIPVGISLKLFEFEPYSRILKTIVGLDSAWISDWWYVGQYIGMVIMFPIIDAIFEIINRNMNFSKQNQRLALGLLFAIGVIAVWLRNTFLLSWFVRLLDNGRFTFTLTFIVGCLCSRYKVFLWGMEYRNYRIVQTPIAVLLLVICLATRWIRTDYSTYCKYDAFITAPLIYAISVLFQHLSKISLILQFIGKYSTFMWLTHRLLILFLLKQLIIEPIKYTVIVYPAVVIVALFTSIVLTMLANKIDLLIKNRIACNKFDKKGAT